MRTKIRKLAELKEKLEDVTFFVVSENSIEFAEKCRTLSERKIPDPPTKLTLNTVAKGNEQFYQTVIKPLPIEKPSLPPFEYGKLEIEKVAHENKKFLEKSYFFKNLDAVIDFIVSVHQRKRIFFSKWFLVKDFSPELENIYILTPTGLGYPHQFWSKNKDLNFWLDNFYSHFNITFGMN
jgi:hypothetical protein